MKILNFSFIVLNIVSFHLVSKILTLNFVNYMKKTNFKEYLLNILLLWAKQQVSKKTKTAH